MLRKVWHGCILMDRMLAMTYGRPCMIGPRSADAVPLPLAIDEEHLLAGPTRPHAVQAQRPAILDFYIWSLKLYDILHDVLYNFYTTDVSQSLPTHGLFDSYFGLSSSSEGRPSLLEFERKLSRWESSIPEHLKIENSKQPLEGGVEAVFHRQAVILHQRYVKSGITITHVVLNLFMKTPSRSPVGIKTYSLELSHLRLQ